MLKRCFYLCLLFALVPACATYQARPLNNQPTLLNEVPHLVVKAGQMPLPELAAHPFNPGDGLDMTETAMLAVVNNPELKALRDKRGIARAELMAAGILPNPQVSAGLDHPTNGGPDVVNAFNLGLSYEIDALITRSAKIDASRAESLKIDLTVLWQEWQVVQQARLLFIAAREQEKLMERLRSFQELMGAKYEQARKALGEGNLTIDVVSAALTELQNANRNINDLERQMSKTRHDLNALLGLSPDVKLDLVGPIDLPEPGQAEIEKELAELPQRRPDLLALQAGYQSQEARFRAAVLAQFPALNIGLTRARDTTGIYTTGIGVTLSLPVFNRNQGTIAIEKATRERLYDEYQARLNEAYAQVKSLLAQLHMASRQYKEASSVLPEMEKTAARAKAALDAGNLGITTYTDLQAALLKKQLEAVNLEQTLLDERAALQTLLGNKLPGPVAAEAVELEK